MNTVGRRLRKSVRQFENYIEDQFIKELVDESKFYSVVQPKNKWDKSIKVAARLTQKYVEKLRDLDRAFCTNHAFICDVLT